MKKRRQSIRLRFFLISFITICLCIASLVLVILLNKTKTRLVDVQKQQVHLLLMADEIREISETLTNDCRSFVATGDEKFLQDYQDTVAWKNGNIPRPSKVHHLLSPGKIISQHDLLKQLGCTKAEMSLLEKSADLSNALVGVEMQAMECVRRGRYVKGIFSMNQGESVKDFALRILYDKSYLNSVEEIRRPVEEFFVKIDARMERKVEAAKRSMNWYAYVSVILLTFLCLWVSISLAKIRRGAINPMPEIAEKLILFGNGDLRVSMETKRNDEVASIVSGFSGAVDKMKKLIITISGMSHFLGEVGDELSTNTTQTASAMNEIRGNIEGVNEQVMMQSESVSHAVLTVDEVMCTSKSLTQSVLKQEKRMLL